MSAVSAQPAPTAARAAAFADLARLLHAAPSPQATLELICRAALFVVPGTQRASITKGDDGRFATAACSDPATRAWDQVQYELGQGPCLDAITAADVVVCADLLIDNRWPALQARMDAPTGVRSVLSLRLFLQQDTVGSLTLYSTVPGAFTGDGQAVAEAFAVHAAVAVQAAQDRFKAANLQAALDSSRQIGAAIGILMARENLTDDAAFHRLRRASQNANRKLRDVADEVVFTGHLAPAPPTPSERIDRAVEAVGSADAVVTVGGVAFAAGRSATHSRAPYRRPLGWPGQCAER